VLEAINRLKARGAETALVYGASVNEPARRLYASAGFRPERKIFNYVKET
jgi:ribosomal protein S18 acetylase RimI-like enzyme